MPLRFPTEYNKNMPFVNFHAWEYVMPAVNVKNSELNRKRSGDFDSVHLFLPGDYSEKIQASWREQEVIGGAVQGFEDMLGSEILNSLNGQMGQKIAATMKAGLASVPYPTDILIFEKVDPIQLSFTFDMLPIRDTEAETIIKICTLFKKAILPKLDTSDKVPRLRFPVVWQINFVGVNGMGIEDVNTYWDMALTNVSVSYPSNNTSILVYRDNNPVQTRLNLSFQSIRKQRNL